MAGYEQNSVTYQPTYTELYIYRYFLRHEEVLFKTKHNRISAVVSWSKRICESERESGERLDITHPTYYDQGATLFSLDNWEQFQELMDQDKLREITLDYWCLFKGGRNISTSSINYYLYMTSYCCYCYQ